MKQILVTDSLFIFDEHKKRLNEAGYELVRLDKPEASEDELIDALRGKVGYILGGVEKLTKRVIDNCPELKAVSFPGIGYKWLIPDWQYAKEKGITIANTPDAPTNAVAEWALTATLAMQRGIFEIGRGSGIDSFKTTKGIESQNIGIYGFGRIGQEIAKKIKPFNPNKITYYSTNQHSEVESSLGVVYRPEEELLSMSDIIYICVPDEVGHDYFNDEKLSHIREGSLVVSISHDGIINIDAIDKAMKRGVRFANDDPIPQLADKYPLDKFFSNLGHNAFNTESETKLASDQAVEALINLLETGEDKNRVV